MNAYEVIDLSGIADSGQDYECTSVNDRLSGGSAACLFCQSGSWKAQRPTRTKTIAASVWSCSNELSSYPDAPYYIYGSDSHYQVASKAQCTSGTLVGGGHELMYYVPKIDRGISGNSPDASFPLGNEWLVIAGGFPSGCFRAFALCAE